MLRNGISIGEMMTSTRRQGQDTGRPDSSERSAGTEPPVVPRKSHSCRFCQERRNRRRMAQAYPQKTWSPRRAPQLASKPHSLGSRGANMSETSLDRPGSSFSQDFGYAAALRSRKTGPVRSFVLATTDYWNYRMVEVTDIDTAAELRQLICINVGLPDIDGVQFYATELGQFDHDEPLDDSRLMVTKKLRADSSGTLKLFVRPPGPPQPLLVVNTGAQAGLSEGYVPEAYALLNGQRRRSSSSPPTSRQNTMTENDRDEKVLTQEAAEYRAETTPQTAGVPREAEASTKSERNQP